MSVYVNIWHTAKLLSAFKGETDVEHPKLFRGTRTEDGCRVVIERGSARRNLDMRLDIVPHSPSGFEWGYRGSGPAQLAVAILAAVLMDDQAAFDAHIHFKEEVVAGMHKPGWVLHEETIWRWYRWWCIRHVLGPSFVPEQVNGKEVDQ